MTTSDSPNRQHGISRRTLLGGVGATAAAGALYAAHRSGGLVFAQEGETQIPATPEALGPTMPPEYDKYAGDWPMQNGNLANTRTSTASKINSGNVGDLGIAWTAPLKAPGTYGAMTSAPVVLGDTIYVVDMQSNIIVLDKKTGKVKWTKEYNVPTIGPNGLIVAYGNVYSVLGDTAEVVCINADTQEDVWRARLSNNLGEGIDMAPLVYDNTVYVSTVPGNSIVFYRGGQKGIFYALDASSGNTIWQWDTTTDDLWGNGRVNSGGGLWNPPAVASDGMLYLAVANAAPYPGNSEFPNASSRPGNNDYANNLVALDPTNTQVTWHVNLKRDDNYDLDTQLSPMICPTKIGGENVDVIVVSGKNGYVIGVERLSGVPLWKIPVGRHQNETVETIPQGQEIRVFPGTLGGVETCLAYSNNVVFAAVLNWGTSYNSTSIAGGLSLDLSDATGQLVAIDVTNGQILWQVDMPTAILGAATIANDVVFTGGLDGVIRGYNVADGSPVLAVMGTAGINAPPALSEDYLFFPTTAAYIESPDSTHIDKPSFAIVAMKLGASQKPTAAAGMGQQTDPGSTPAAGSSIAPNASNEATPVTGPNAAPSPSDTPSS